MAVAVFFLALPRQVPTLTPLLLGAEGRPLATARYRRVCVFLPLAGEREAPQAVFHQAAEVAAVAGRPPGRSISLALLGQQAKEMEAGWDFLQTLVPSGLVVAAAVAALRAAMLQARLAGLAAPDFLVL